MTKLRVLVPVLLLAGCGSFPARKTPFAPGKVLIVTPRDAEHRGRTDPHALGTGSALANALARGLAGSTLEPIVGTVDEHPDRAGAKERALLAAKSAGADYCLVLDLASDREQPPLSDGGFATNTLLLRAGSMWAVDGSEVWALTGPVTMHGAAPGRVVELAPDLARRVAGSLLQ